MRFNRTQVRLALDDTSLEALQRIIELFTNQGYECSLSDACNIAIQNIDSIAELTYVYGNYVTRAKQRKE